MMYQRFFSLLSAAVFAMSPLLSVSAEDFPSETANDVSLAGVTYRLSENAAMVVAANPECEHVTIPDTVGGLPVTAIVEDAFRDNEMLRFIQLPDSLTSIGDYVFSGCFSLRIVKLPDNLTYIGEGAFSSCADLEEITLPDALTHLGAEAFRSTALHTVTLPAGITSISDACFANCLALDTVLLPDSLTAIETDAFRDSGLMKLALPDSVCSIGAFAFAGTKYLQTIAIPAGVNDIGEGCFAQSGVPDIQVLAADCALYDSPDTFPETAVLSGEPDSTTFAYAEKYGRTFHSLTTRGDADCDGLCTVIDAVIIARLVAGDKTVQVSEQGLRNSNVDGEEGISADDLTKVLQYLAKQITAL